MELVAFTVENYRSITKARRIRLGNYTVLIGPNNEGKSNILRALVAAMEILTRGRRAFITVRRVVRERFIAERFYDWKRDYPVNLQSRRPDGESILILEFELDGEEIKEFKRDIKSDLNGTLPLRITLGDKQCDVKVAKQGRGAKTLSDKSSRIAGFISKRLQFEYIPAIRTARSATEVVSRLVQRELQQVEDDPAFEAALAEIARLQRPVLERLSDNIKDTLIKFLPTVDSVKVEIPAEERYRALRRSCSIVIDDGVPTELQYKGDGVQSLAALAIMRHASERGAAGRNLIIAVEEPESHLHPNAIHELRRVLHDLTQQHQVVISTHCPLFVDRADVSRNIIVNKRQARPANTVREIRTILGTLVSDNLTNAEAIVLVEGEDDRTALSALLAHASEILRRALEEGILALDSLAGASNLAYKVSLVHRAQCQCYCFLDADKPARLAFGKCTAQNLLRPADVTFATCEGFAEAEIEDMYLPGLYGPMILDKYGVSLESAKFRNNRKWSRRMRDTFTQQGKIWDDLEAEVKMDVARLVASSPGAALDPRRRSALDALVRSLEKLLTKSGQPE